MAAYNKHNRRSLIKNFVLLFIVLFSCFMVLEIYLRLFWQKPPGYGYPDGLHIPDDLKGYRYNPNFRGKFLGKLYENIDININSKGLRDYEHNYNSSKNKIRILGIGDSVAFGSGIKFEDTYLAQLEKKMLDDGHNVEIVKAGVDGYEFEQEYVWFFDELYRYKPDIVMIGVVLNDIRNINPYEIAQERLDNSNKKTGSILKCCKTCEFAYISLGQLKLKLILKKKSYNEFYFENIYRLWVDNLTDYKSRLIELNGHLKKNNAKLILVIFPYTEQFKNSLDYGRLPQEKILNISKSANITVIDLMGVLDLENYKELYLPIDDVHLSPKGNKIVTNAIYNELLNKKMLDRS